VAEPVALGPARANALRASLATLASIAFGVSFGFNYGVGNQVTYLIPALRRLDPELFARDWFATQTTQYHPVFAAFAAALVSFDRRGWAVALGLPLTVACAMLCLHALARRLVGPRAGLAVFLILAALLFATKTRGPALTYVFDGELQPSSLSSAFLVGAVLTFSAGHFVASGALLGLGGLFHLNFLLLSGAAFAVAHVLLGRERVGVRLVQQLALPLASAALFLPMFVRAAAASPDAALGRHIYLAIRAPHHFMLATRLEEFAPLLAWQCLAAAAVVPLLRAPAPAPFARLAACAAGITGVVWLGVLAALGSERAATLFAWRLAPHAELLLALASIAVGVRVLVEPSLAHRFGKRERVLVALGFALVLGTYVARRDFVPAQVVAAAGLLGVAAWRWLRAAHHAPELVVGLALVLLAGFAGGPVARVARHSSLLGAPSPASGLCAWMRERTAKSALFLTPPDADSIRFFGERAIVVDWKGNPAVPHEVLAWYRRLEDVTGRSGFTNESGLRGYEMLDREHLEALRARYGFEYAVVRRGREAGFGHYRRAFEDEHFVVLTLPAVGEAAHAL
jgi:hypothetical protein